MAHDFACLVVKKRSEKLDSFHNDTMLYKGMVPYFIDDDLSTIPNATVYVVGHGNVRQPAAKINEYSPPGLADALAKLPGSVKRIKLFSCFSGVVMPGRQRSFAAEFAEHFEKTHPGVEVYGYLGAVQFGMQRSAHGEGKRVHGKIQLDGSKRSHTTAAHEARARFDGGRAEVATGVLKEPFFGKSTLIVKPKPAA